MWYWTWKNGRAAYTLGVFENGAWRWVPGVMNDFGFVVEVV